MRIAIVSPPWVAVPPAGYGGTERVIDDLCRAFVADEHEVLLYATGDSTTCGVELAWTFETARGTEHASPAAELRHVTDAYDAVLEWGADVVHDHTMSGPFYSERYPDLPVLTTNHGPFEGDLRALYRRVAGRVPVIAISRHQAKTARGIPIAAVIHHGVDVDSFPMGTGARGHALFLGRMSPDKGVHTAIHVARQAGIPLRIAAKMREKDEFEYFEERIKPQLGGQIEYLGEVGGPAKLELIADALCLLNPIQWPEPFGMVMIEALACGTPVVSTSQGAAREIVDDGHTGFLRNDEASLATALGYVEGLDRHAVRRAAETRFSAHRMAADHTKLFEAVVESRSWRQLEDTARSA